MQEKSYKKILSEREQELAERSEELEAQREELTAAVEAAVTKNLHLEEALHQLNTINKEVDEIVYRSAHDLKTPISAIEGLLKLIELDAENASQYIAKAHDAIRDSKYMLKTLARYSSNLVKTVDVEDIHLSQLWDEVLLELKQVPGYDQVKINFTAAVPTIRSDRYRVRQLLYNLVRNSIDYRKSNGRVNVDMALSKSRDVDVIELRVIDNGIGIPYDIQDKVFDMFYRGTVESHGAGLGLYLCKRIVHILNGNIRLISYPDVGTTVTVQLPG